MGARPAPHHQRRVLMLIAVGVLAVVIGPLAGVRSAGAAAAGSQVVPGSSRAVAGRTAPAAAGAGFDLRLTALRPAVPQPGDVLTVAGTVIDAGPRTVTDVQVYLRFPGAPMADRTAMAAVAATPAGDPTTSGPLYVDHYAQLAGLRPGGAATFSLSVPMAALGLGAAGVYPLTVEVRATTGSGARIAAADVRTYLPWQIGTGSRAAATRIRTGWIIPLTTAAVRVSTSVFVDGTLAASLAPTGRLGRLLDLLTTVGPTTGTVEPGRAARPGGAAQAGTTVQVAIDPMLVAEVEEMTGDYRVQDSASRTTTGTSAATVAATPSPTASPATAPEREDATPTATTGSAPPAVATTPTRTATPTSATASPTTITPTTTPKPTPAASSTAGPTPGVTPAGTEPGQAQVATALSDADLPQVHTRAGHGQALARDFLARLRTVVAGQPVFVLPWSDPDLGAVADPRSQLGRTALAGTWAQGMALVRALGADPVPLAWPSLGTATADELELAGASGATTTLLPTVALVGSGAPAAGTSAAATLGDRPSGAPVGVLRADTGLDTALAAADPLLGRQAYLAQTALLATAAAAATRHPTGGHPVLAVLPRDWDPPAVGVPELLGSTATPGWIVRAPDLGTPATAGGPAVTLRVHLAVLARQHPGDPAAAGPQLTAATRAALAALAQQTRTLGSLLTEPALTRQGLRAQRLQLASVELVDRPVRWNRLAGAVSRTVQGIRESVRLVPPNAVSLSNGTGRFPVVVVNALAQAVTIRLQMSTANRTRLAVGSLSGVTLPAGQRTTLEISANTHTHGLVEVQAVLQDSAGRALEAPLSFAVHSNSYDEIGWVIIVGAGALLFGATAVRLGRRIHVHARRRRV